MSASKDCTDCLDSSYAGYWVPCKQNNGSVVCKPCDRADGYLNPETCMNAVKSGQRPIDCSDLCYSPCDKCTSNNCTDPSSCTFNPVGEEFTLTYSNGPYAPLKDTWGVQRPFTLN
jgi:hypothetical protein